MGEFRVDDSQTVAANHPIQARIDPSVEGAIGRIVKNQFGARAAELPRRRIQITGRAKTFLRREGGGELSFRSSGSGFRIHGFKGVGSLEVMRTFLPAISASFCYHDRTLVVFGGLRLVFCSLR